MNSLAKWTLASLLAIGSLAGCSNTSTSQSTESSEESASSETLYKDSLELIDAIYSNMESDEMPSIVGGYGDEMVSDEPAALDTQSNVVAQAFAIPLEVLNEAVSAASFSHALMANNLSVVVLEFANGTDLEDLAGQIEEQVKDNQWICSIPERFEIYSMGNYLVYAFGSDDLLALFNTALDQLDQTPVELADQPIE